MALLRIPHHPSYRPLPKLSVCFIASRERSLWAVLPSPMRNTLAPKTHLVPFLWGCLHASVTMTIAVRDALLEDLAAPEHRIQGYVTLLAEKQTELSALDSRTRPFKPIAPQPGTMAFSKFRPVRTLPSRRLLLSPVRRAPLLVSLCKVEW